MYATYILSNVYILSVTTQPIYTRGSTFVPGVIVTGQRVPLTKAYYSTQFRDFLFIQDIITWMQNMRKRI